MTWGQKKKIQGDARQRLKIMPYGGSFGTAQHRSVAHGVPAVESRWCRKAKGYKEAGTLMWGSGIVVDDRLRESHQPGETYAEN
ncbi:hypothetical protein GRAN_4993 [Granulicella sibirica]|uniref:Uncharacterized protein n=1 Tax=Granulicella sibirica TaxID=2479048 RepID=A0A4V1L4Z9_9BACT|nr:hypothetical protein GRAN_4993 [Granulicella sibirica]